FKTEGRDGCDALQKAAAVKTEYHADMAAPFSRSLCELLEKLETMSAEDGNRVVCRGREPSSKLAGRHSPETSRCSRPRSFSDTLSNVRRWRGSHETFRARPRGVEWPIDGVAVQKCLRIKTWRVRNARTNGENESPLETEWPVMLSR